MSDNQGIDATINGFFEPIANTANAIVFYSVPLGEGADLKLILAWLVAAGVFFTLYLGFINIRYFKHAISVVMRKDDEEKKEDGQISSFQALMAVLSGTVGLGNIGGVAIAVSTGGPGAVFWMVLMGFLGMSSKFAETMLGVKYRVHANPERPEEISGGPMYYLRTAFDRKNLHYAGVFFAGMFAIFCIGASISGGNMFQINQSYRQFVDVTGGENSFLNAYGWAFGLVVAVLVGLVIVGGIKSIASVAARLVPLMAIIYIVAGLIVILMNAPQVPGAVLQIIEQAFTPEAGYGGFIGVLLVGAQRAFFSNEAGLGSAPIVHATVKTDSPVAQGMVGMLGPFIDTVVICSVTALVIVVTGVYDHRDGLQGVELTSRAFESTIPGFRYVLALTVFLFAFSTVITWFYYGMKSLTYLFGEKSRVEMVFKLFFCFCVVVGASSDISHVVDFTDAMFFALAIPNVIGLYIFAPEIKRDVRAYIMRLKEADASS